MLSHIPSPFAFIYGKSYPCAFPSLEKLFFSFLNSPFLVKIRFFVAGELAPWLRALVALSEVLSSIQPHGGSRPSAMGGSNALLFIYSSSLCPCGSLPDPRLSLSLALSPCLKGALEVTDPCAACTMEARLHSEFQANLRYRETPLKHRDLEKAGYEELLPFLDISSRRMV